MINNSKICLSESTKKILEDDNITIVEEDSIEEIVRKLAESKKVVAKLEENGTISIKQVLND